MFLLQILMNVLNNYTTVHKYVTISQVPLYVTVIVAGL